MINNTDYKAIRKEDGCAYIYDIKYQFVPYRNYAEVVLTLNDVLSFSDDDEEPDIANEDREETLIWEYEEESLVEMLKAEGYIAEKDDEKYEPEDED